MKRTMTHTVSTSLTDAIQARHAAAAVSKRKILDEVIAAMGFKGRM